MEATVRLNTALAGALAAASGDVSGGQAPPKLAEALQYAVFPGGARVRPQLCLAVARACGDDEPALADAAAASIELLHCASLVHDDLPCFDDASTRRGKPSVHKVFGEPVALLAGDSLIVLAFETLAKAAPACCVRLVPLTLAIARSVGMPHGIVAGQAWESEPAPDLSEYQRAKTGSLFVAATAAGAIAAGADPAPWRSLGDRLGEAYQVADDICDAVAEPADVGKPCGQDILHSRPNAVVQLGLDGAVRRLEDLVTAAADSVPECPGASALRNLVHLQAKRLVPKSLSRTAA